MSWLTWRGPLGGVGVRAGRYCWETTPPLAFPFQKIRENRPDTLHPAKSLIVHERRGKLLTITGDTMKRQRIDDFTERAIRATDAGKLLPPIVYLPRRLRGQKVRLTEDHLRYTVDAPTVAENHVKIQAADPVGFLVAIMNGQPIPEFRVTANGAIDLYYAVADMDVRVKVATYLANKATIVRDYGDGRAWRGDKSALQAYEKMVAASAERGQNPIADENEDTNGVQETD
jgi:hypothetical protein